MTTTHAVATTLRAGYERARRGPHGLRARVRALEAEVQEQRQLNRRVAELTDVVAELLLPMHQWDIDRVDEVLDGYRAKI